MPLMSVEDRTHGSAHGQMAKGVVFIRSLKAQRMAARVRSNTWHREGY